jgi:hypothetical protein
MTNHDSMIAIQKLLPHAEARQETLRLLAHGNQDYQSRYEDCRHALSYAYHALGDDAPNAPAPRPSSVTTIWSLPPDPEAMNNDRAEWAATALRQFQSSTGSDFEDALADLLGDLMHWADRNAVVFENELSRARMHYEAETAVEDPVPGPAAETAPDDRPPDNDPVPSGPAAAAAIKTYRAEFFTAADYASRDFEADTPEQALQLARRFYDEDIGELDFRSNDDNAGLDLIQIWDSKRGTLASWESDEYRLRNEAPELLAALNRILPRYADFLSGAGADLKACEDYQTAKAAVVRASPTKTQ